MGSGYVLNFSNRTFTELFRQEFQVDIADSRWQVQGGRTAQRFRSYLQQEERRTALDTPSALWKHREVNGFYNHYRDWDDTTDESSRTRNTV